MHRLLHRQCSLAYGTCKNGLQADVHPSAHMFLQALAGYSEWQQVHGNVRQRVLLAAATAVVEAFKGACEELLDSVAKTQASLSKFRRATPAGAGSNADTGMSSMAKIQNQLQLDVAECGRLLKKLLGTRATDIAEFSELARIVDASEEEGSMAAGTSSAVAQGQAAPSGVPQAASPAAMQPAAAQHHGKDADSMTAMAQDVDQLSVKPNGGAALNGADPHKAGDAG